MTENKKEPLQTLRIEPRWPAALTILVVYFLLAVLPERVRLFPVWVPSVTVIVVLASMAAIPLTAAKVPWRRVEHTIMLIFFVVAGSGTLASLVYLIRAMVRRGTEIGGLQLLTSSIAVWVINVLTFSLLYWQIDRNGPEARANNEGRRPDWLFPQTGVPEEAPPAWRPTFIDYLFLAFSTATAFSPTDALPLTSRAKLLMMLESAISLTTIVVVASRAINILGS
ncbi:MAG: hypothetical protein WCA07_06385 [Gloeobacterales cyanobacterium]